MEFAQRAEMHRCNVMILCFFPVCCRSFMIDPLYAMGALQSSSNDCSRIAAVPPARVPSVRGESEVPSATSACLPTHVEHIVIDALDLCDGPRDRRWPAEPASSWRALWRRWLRPQIWVITPTISSLATTEPARKPLRPAARLLSTTPLTSTIHSGRCVIHKSIHRCRPRRPQKPLAIHRIST